MIPTSTLLRHTKIMSDWEIKQDFIDCLLPLADPNDRSTLMKYRSRRMSHSTFDGHRHPTSQNPSKNNHSQAIKNYRDASQIS